MLTLRLCVTSQNNQPIGNALPVARDRIQRVVRPLKFMITQNINETRKDYLIRVAIELINNSSAYSETIEFDEAECDGACLADDLQAVLDYEH